MIHRGDLSHRERVTNLLLLREKVPSGSQALSTPRTNSGHPRVENRRNRAEFLGMGAIAPGNGAVFQLVPQRFPREIGVMTGIVGSAGGLGGFVLPTALGASKQATGSFSGGFLAFALVGGLGGALALAHASRGWRGIFLGEGG